MRRLIPVLALLVLAGCRPADPGTGEYHLTVGGLDRTFTVYAPAGRAGPLPVVLALHGDLGTGQGMRDLTHLDRVADADGFIVVYPDGYRRSWADGRGVTAADRAGVDDVAFLGAVLSTVDNDYPADPARDYVTGISNGGFMAHRLGCDLSSRITAIAPDAAGMSTALAARCHPTRPVAVLDIQGTADPFVPYQGGAVAGQRGTVLSAADTVARWAALDGSRAPVQLRTVSGGGHTWPDGASVLIGQFFSAHR